MCCGMLPQPVVGAAVPAVLADVLVAPPPELPELALPELSFELPQATKAMAATSITSRAMALLILILSPSSAAGCHRRSAPRRPRYGALGSNVSTCVRSRQDASGTQT